MTGETKQFEDQVLHEEELEEDKKLFKEKGEGSAGCDCSSEEDSFADQIKADDKTDDAVCDEEGANQEQEAKEEESANEKYIRLMADFQNYKRRAEKERSDIYAYANEKIATDMLTVIDNFERALGQGSEDKSFEEGMNLIFKQMMDALTKAGLEEIIALGEDFDPNMHNAVMMCDNPDFESGKVTEVLQKGYKLNGKLIRASMVKVNN